MGITSSVGYGGQVTEAQIPRWVRAIGGVDYTVRGPGSWKVTASGSGARTVQIASGTEGAGKGVSDVSAGGELVELPNPAAGSRWYVVCVHRNTTGTGGTTTLTYVGVASPSTAGATDPWAALALRETFETTANITDDQPLALVRVTKDNPTIAAGDVIDLRCWQANGGLVGASDYVRGYLDRPGTQIMIGTDLWTRSVTAGGVAEWVRTPLLRPVNLLGAGAANVGDSVPPGVPIYMQAGTHVQVTNGGGHGIVTFPVAFPNGLLTVTCSPGDDMSNPGIITNPFAYTKTGFTYRVWGDYGATASNVNHGVLHGYQHRLNWVAFGW